MGLVSEYLENKRDIDVLAFRDSMHHLSTLTLILGIVLAILSYFNQWYFMLAIINMIMSIKRKYPLGVGQHIRGTDMVKRRGFKRKPEIKHEPLWEKGDLLQNTKNPNRLAIVKEVVQDWDNWKYILAEKQRGYESNTVVFDDIFEIRHTEKIYWVKFNN